LEDELIAKLMAIVATIFAGHQVGDPRFLEKMLSGQVIVFIGNAILYADRIW
jgi:hypothetical protein